MTISNEAKEAAQHIAIECDIVVDSLNHIEQQIQLAIDKAVAEATKPLKLEHDILVGKLTNERRYSEQLAEKCKSLVEALQTCIDAFVTLDKKTVTFLVSHRTFVLFIWRILK